MVARQSNGKKSASMANQIATGASAMAVPERL